MIQIKHVQQTLNNNCVSACLAMLTGEDINVVTAIFHDDYQAHKITVQDFLEDWEVNLAPKLTINGALHPGRLYIITVPSINVKGLLHQVIVDWRDADSNYHIYDPCMNKHDRLYYNSEVNDDPSSFIMQSWVVDYEILECPHLEYKAIV